MKNSLIRKQIALPTDHGSWVFLLSPLLIGLFAGGNFSSTHAWLILTLLGVFLLRTPASTLVKTLSGRRSGKERPAALLWIGIYGLAALVGVAALALEGVSYYIFWLAPPGLLVFGWHLWLVSKRQERRQMGIDILASGTLALAAPAAYWISTGRIEEAGWWLWVLTWLQSAASIVYAFLRLDQRGLKEVTGRKVTWRMGSRSLFYSGFNLGLTVIAVVAGWLPGMIWIPYLLQFAEVLWGITNPATGMKPTSIGFRQLAVSSLFTVLFILLW
jgi:hypothetical protein